MPFPTSKTYDLIIAGAGPTGLLAGLLALRSGLDVLILEKNAEPVLHSRSIGIHPPSLRLFSEAEMLDDFLGKGLAITRGHALTHHRAPLGTLDFGELEPPFNHILTVPQWITELVLTQKLTDLLPGVLQRDMAVTGIHQLEDRCEVVVKEGRNGKEFTLRTRFVMGCDGKKSTVRQMAGISFHGGSYPHRYAMGDFTDRTNYGTDALIFLSEAGLVECFPLPPGTRRWVMQLDPSMPAKDAREFSRQVEQRCGIAPDPQTCSMFSEFGVERFMAERFWKGRVVLAGDSAHVTSPIGGQGMNLGWINASVAVQSIDAVLQGERRLEEASRHYNRIAGKRARKVIRRAEFNMLLGNRSRFPGLRNRAVRTLLGTPLRKILLHRFTMQGL